MMIHLYRRGYKAHQFLTDSTATIKRKFMEFTELSVTLYSDSYFAVKRGDYLDIDGERFSFFELPSVEMNAKRQYQYECTLHSEEKGMEDVLFLFLDTDGANRIYQSSTEYDLTATIDEFLSLVCKNMNRVSDGWKYCVLSDVDRSGLVNISFSGESVKNALKKVTDAFELEYSIVGKNIKVGKKVSEKTGLSFSYPKNLLTPIELDLDGNDKRATKLYVFGGERNIPSGYQDGKSNRLLMPEGLQFLTANGDSVIEKVKVFDDIYPRRNAKIDRVTKNGSGFFFVSDKSIDFNFLSSLTDTTAKIAFTSGLLVGYEFEIASYNGDTKTFELKQQIDGGVTIPNEAICPRVGDDYVLLDIKLPTQYILNAEKELQTEAKKYFDEECGDEYTIKIKPSDIWLQNHGIKFNAGDVINVRCDEMGIDQDIRIDSVTLYPFSQRTQEIELSNIKKKTKLETILDEITANTDSGSQTARAQSNSGNGTALSVNDLDNRTQWRED